jgi:PAS domain-containing protein
VVLIATRLKRPPEGAAGGRKYGVVYTERMSQPLLVYWGILQMPITGSLFFMGIIAAMGFELSRDVLRVVQLGRDLHESEERMTLAAEATNLGVWFRNLGRNEIWASDKFRALFGFTQSEPLNYDHIFQRLHPDDGWPTAMSRDLMRSGYVVARPMMKNSLAPPISSLWLTSETVTRWFQKCVGCRSD